MKKNILIMCAAGMLGLTTGCTDLDVSVDSQYTEYPSSEIAQEAKLSDVYYHLLGTLGRRYMEAQALSSDEWVSITFDGDYWDSGTYAHMCQHNFSPDDASIGWYEDVASGITKANFAIRDMGGSNGGAGVASARAIRAFYHFILMDSYGDVPVLDSIVGETDVIQRQPRAKVAQFIADELETVIPQLKTEVSKNTYGKPTRWMAEALLAKLYLNWPVYTAASVDAYDAASYSNDKLNRVVELCDDIIQSGKFDLTDSYLSKFYPNNGPQIKDFIYAMPYDAIKQTGMQYGRPRTWRKANDAGGSYYGTKLSRSVGGNFSITPEMSDLLMGLSQDDRQGHVLAGTIYVYDPVTYQKTSTPWKYKDHTITLSKTITLKENGEDQLNVGNDENGYNQGYKSVKWIISDADFMNERNQGNDLPIFRFADVILMKAEAITRGAMATNGDTPQSLFNQIRSYVHAPQIDHNPSLEEIYNERGREFFDENWRRNDMIRFGHFEDEYGFHKRSYKNASFDKTRRVFPIPTSVLNKTGWSQNAGYNH